MRYAKLLIKYFVDYSTGRKIYLQRQFNKFCHPAMLLSLFKSIFLQVLHKDQIQID